MFFLLKIGWRNILRNKKRSLLCSLSIGVGLAAVIITDAFMKGMITNMVEEITTVFLGEGQVINREFRVTNEIEDHLYRRDELLARLSADKRVRAYSERIQVNAMISTPEDVQNIALMGIDWDREGNVSELKNRILDKKLLGLTENEILIGKKLGERLDVRVGEKIVLTAAEAKTDQVVQELFRVVAYFDMGSKEMNESLTFISLKKARKMLKLPGGHYIALRFHDVKKVKASFWQEYSDSKNVALSWKKISPAFTNAIEMSKYSSLIIAAILFAIVAFGIMNTIFMSIFDRLYEFGVLKSVGTKPFKIFGMVITESFWLTTVSIFFSFIITAVFGYYLATTGVNYDGVEFDNMTFTRPVVAEFEIFQFILFPLLIFIFTTCISIYPAFYAARIKAVDAMKKSL